MSGPEIDVLPDSLEVYENRIDSAIDEFCLRFDIPDMRKEAQSVWVACLTFCYRLIFKPDKSLLFNRKSVLDYDKDLDIISGLADYYAFKCELYDKAISAYEFSKLIGLSEERLYDWKKGDSSDSKLSTEKSKIIKRLYKARENSLSNKLLKGGNQVGTIAILNRQFNWALPGVTREEATPKLTRNELLQGLDALPDKPVLSDKSSGDE